MNTENNLFKAFTNADPLVVSFSYRGVFSDDMTSRFVDISENTITDQKGLPKVSKKVSFLLVESFQNILRHADLRKSRASRQDDDGIFCFRNHADQYSINGINFLSKEHKQGLIGSISCVNNADADELKSMHRDKLANGTLSEKGGAGLGFIEMARKSKQKIYYKIDDTADDRSQFHHQISFVNDNAESLQCYLDDTEQMYDAMVENDQILMYKGDFSQRSIMPIIHILETNFGDSRKEMNRKKRMMHLLVEMLQNVSKHGAEQNGCNDGIFTISENEDAIEIKIGNLVEKEDLMNLTRKLEEINSADKEQLAAMHLNRLKDSISNEEKNKSGLGLIEIAKYSKSKLSYTVEHLENDLSFFTLGATA